MLPGVGVRQLANLQVDHDQATPSAVKEEQVDAMPLVTDPQTPLSSDEGEVAAKFQQAVFQLAD